MNISKSSKTEKLMNPTLKYWSNKRRDMTVWMKKEEDQLMTSKEDKSNI